MRFRALILSGRWVHDGESNRKADGQRNWNYHLGVVEGFGVLWGSRVVSCRSKEVEVK